MREILFRGRRLDNSEWVVGIFSYSKWYLNGEFTGEITYYIRPVGTQDAFEIDVSTAGQYIGLTDKNGNRIFEGDIIKQIWHKSNERDKRSVGKIFFDERNFAYAAMDVETGEIIPIGRADADNWEVERIGNVHENRKPENADPKIQ